MSAQKDCEFLVKGARDLVSNDPSCWLEWNVTLVSCLDNMRYTIERNVEKTASAGRLLYEMGVKVLIST
uniref:Uncharacterized protein n=1 Tax=Hucho hucho TaxID=62062 RepID=A0A4W5LAP8_9TELE